MEYQGTISMLWAIIMGLGKFQNSVYSTAYKEHKDSLHINILEKYGPHTCFRFPKVYLER
jgi:hypothetical protein